METTTAPLSINYIPILEKYTWWEDVKKRKWVIVGRNIEVLTTGKSLIFTGRSVSMLELHQEEPMELDWKDVVAMIEAGKMTRIKPDEKV